MGMNYASALKTWYSRRKGRDYKPWKNDTHITLGDKGEMLFTYCPYLYSTVDGKFSKSKSKGTPLAVITPDDILTLLIETSYRSPTINNRLTEILGCAVYSDTSGHRNKESAVRISKRYFHDNKFAGVTDWNDDPANGNIPYKPGIQFQMDDTGCPVKVLNPPEDRIRRVKRDLIPVVSKQTAQMRKLMNVMSRLGSFDAFAKGKAERNYSRWGIETKAIEQIDVANPIGDDAISLFVLGLNGTHSPDRGGYVGGNYVDYPLEQRMDEVKTKAIDAGMRLLRQQLYGTLNAYEVVPVKQPKKE